ncbi:MAG: hypothetical protein ACRD0O_00820 [Acidimicrobiia bacterium]
MGRYPNQMVPGAPRRKHRDEPPPDPGAVEVRHVQPYEALKAYRCPGCDHEIPAGTGHEVVVPREAPELRRHWHTGCWWRARRPS